MPAPGDQHKAYSARVSTANPFEEPVPRIDEYTAQEIATLQSRLDKRLGPEYISSRAGPGGQKVHYLAADKCISLANEVFGFNGWSSSIQNIQIDFVDENPNTGKISLGLSVIVRVTLKNGTYHEDVGYGHIENCKGKAAAFEKAKKEGTTDALKRTLRTFGNVLGNCIYDKDYLSKVTKVKAVPARWDVDDLHRHADFVPLKKELVVSPPITEKAEVRTERNVPPKVTDNPTKIPKETLSIDLDNEFGSDAFDEADFGDHALGHPDEVVLDEESHVEGQHLRVEHPPIGQRAQTGPAGVTPGAIPSHMDTPSKPPQRPYLAGPATGHTHASLSVAADTRGRPNFAHANQYTTPKAQPAVRPQQPANDSKPLPGRPSNQNNDLPPPLPCDQSKMNNEPAALVKRSHSPSKTTPSLGSETPQETPAVEPGIWYSARVATMTEPGKPAPTFDPKFESPSLRKTYTVDHNKSAPVSRKTFQNLPPPSSSQALHKPIIHNAPSSSQTTPLSARTAVDFNKRPGPGTFASPAKPTLTTSYRPPTRRSMTAAANDTTTAQNMNGKRPPLSEMTNIPPVPGNADALKKPKVGENPAHNVVLEHDRPR